MSRIQQLYPICRDLPFPGVYLAHDLRALACSRHGPLVYANYVASLDGRIALPAPDGHLGVPPSLANERDWRLFQELAAQADLILSTGRYLRDWAAGRAQEILQVDDPRFEDLRTWRVSHGLSPQPDLAIISNTLDFPIPKVLHAGGRGVVVVTSEQADSGKVQALEEEVGPVIRAGRSHVEGRALVDALYARGYQLLYCAAGPKVLHTLARDQVLDRLYLTLVPRLLGGERFATLAEGTLLNPPLGGRLEALYRDPEALEGLGQLFLCYTMGKDGSTMANALRSSAH